jgi:hypothetical protein
MYEVVGIKISPFWELGVSLSLHAVNCTIAASSGDLDMKPLIWHARLQQVAQSAEIFISPQKGTPAEKNMLSSSASHGKS